MKIACQHLTCFNCTREITPIARQSKLIKKTEAVYSNLICTTYHHNIIIIY